MSAPALGAQAVGELGPASPGQAGPTGAVLGATGVWRWRTGPGHASGSPHTGVSALTLRLREAVRVSVSMTQKRL